MQMDEVLYKRFIDEIGSGVPVYYVAVTGSMNLELGKRAKTWAVPDDYIEKIENVLPGEYALFFGRTVGMQIYRLASGYLTDTKKIWDDEVYPHRVKLEESPILILSVNEFTMQDMLGVLLDASEKPYKNTTSMGASLQGGGGIFRRLKPAEVGNLLRALEFIKEARSNAASDTDLDKAARKIKETYETLDIKTKTKRKEDKKSVFDDFGGKFSLENIDNIDFSDLDRFADFNENGHWTGLERQKRNIRENNTIGTVRTHLHSLLAEGRDIQIRINEAFKNLINFGPLLLTAILHIAYPEKYSVVNRPAVNALHKLNLIAHKTVNVTLQHYTEYNKIVSDLVNKTGLDRWDIDWALFQIANDENEANEEIPQPLTPPSEELEFSNLPKNVILYGPVGTGKTVLADILARKIVNKELEDRTEIPGLILQDLAEESKRSSVNNAHMIKKITFHQSYGYEEFIEGVTVHTEHSNVIYETKPGVFREMCKTASENPGENYVLVIDEINRGEISRIFGELITTIEEDKRSSKGDGKYSTILPLSRDSFFVPENLYIIGTMNNTDRSIALLDVALRRRFTFFYVPPSEKPIEKWLSSDESMDEGFKTSLLNTFIRLNGEICKTKGEDFQIGHGFFSELRNSKNKLGSSQWIFRHKIIPLLMEHFYGEYGKLIEIFDGTFLDESSDDDHIRWKETIFMEGQEEAFKSDLKEFSEMNE